MSDVVNEKIKAGAKGGNKKIVTGVIIALVLALSVAGTALYRNANKIYTVTFNSQGGSEVAAAQIKNGDTLTSVEEPYKENYKFNNWVYLDGTVFDISTPITEDVELYATYTLQCTVTFNYDENGDSYKRVVVGEGQVVSKPSESPEKTGFVFDKWLCNGEEYNFDEPVTSNLTLTPLFREIFEVTFVYDDGKTNDFVTSVIQGEMIEKPEDPSKDGYDFTGWYLDNNLFDFDSPIEGNYTLKAKYSLILVEPTSISAKDVNVNKGSTSKISVTINPSNTNSKNKLTYSSANKSIATVDGNGVVTGVKGGATTITITSENGVSTKINVYVDERYLDATVFDNPITGTLYVYSGKQREFRVFLHYYEKGVEKSMDVTNTAGLSFHSDIMYSATSRGKKTDASGKTYIFVGGSTQSANNTSVTSGGFYFTAVVDGVEYKTTTYNLCVEPLVKIVSVYGDVSSWDQSGIVLKKDAKSFVMEMNAFGNWQYDGFIAPSASFSLAGSNRMGFVYNGNASNNWGHAIFVTNGGQIFKAEVKALY